MEALARAEPRGCTLSSPALSDAPQIGLKLREEAPDRLAREGRDRVSAIEFAPGHGMTVVAALIRHARRRGDGHGLAFAVIGTDPVVAAGLTLRERHHVVHVSV